MRRSSSSLWQFERTQRALRMRQSQARFWKFPIQLIWLLGTVGYGWIRVSELGRAYFFTWVTATLWNTAWPRHAVLFQGQLRDAAALTQWFDRYIYGTSLLSLSLHAGLAGAALAGVCTVAFLCYAKGRAPASPDEHIRGVQLVDTATLQAQITTPTRWWRTPDQPGICLAGIDTPRHLETSQYLAMGSTGVGKSTQLRALLYQIQTRRETAIIFDPECELTPEFYDPQRDDQILNPSDRRCPYWSPWLEIDTPADRATLATSVLPDPPDQRGGNERYFVTAARALLIRLLEKLQPQTPQSLTTSLTGSLDNLFALVAGSSAGAHVNKDAAEQRSGVLSTLQLALEGLPFLPPESETKWSAREWEQSRRGWLFFPCRESDREAILPLQSVWIDCVIRRLLDATNCPRVWLIIDELATLKRLQHLEGILTRGRKHNVSIVLGCQAISQLRSLYGREATATLMAAPATHLFMRTKDPETAKWCSDALGSREVIWPQENETAGPQDMSDRMGVTYARRNESIVLPSQIQQLPNYTGYLSIAGYDIAQVSFAEVPRWQRYPGFLPRSTSTVEPPEAPPVRPRRSVQC